MRNGWLHTGDVAVMEPDGYFRIVDRLKEMIVVSASTCTRRRSRRSCSTTRRSRAR